MSASTTPRTDAAALGFARILINHEDKGSITELVDSNFARQLERELTAANAKLPAFESVEVPEELAQIVFLRQLNNPTQRDKELLAYIDTLLRAYRAQAVRLREAERDAGRYRWMNKQDNFLCDLEMHDGQRRFRLKCGEHLDVWIDARISEEFTQGTACRRNPRNPGAGMTMPADKMTCRGAA